MSLLTTAQAAAVKADILAASDMNTLPHNSDGATAIAVLYNTLVTNPGTFFVYRTNIPVGEVLGQITWANLTPIDTPDGTQQWANRALQCQGKQFNVQLLLGGNQQVIDASRSNMRAGLQDALTNIPAGASGVSVSAGWTSVRDNVLARAATRIEKLLVTGGAGGTAATAGTMGYEGPISADEIRNQVMGW